MKVYLIPLVVLSASSTFVAAGPAVLAIRVALTAVKTISKVAKPAMKAAKSANKVHDASKEVKGHRNRRRPRDLFDGEDGEPVLFVRDRSVQEWIDMTYDPYHGDGISKEIVVLLRQLGRIPPASSASCPTRTKTIPAFSHQVKIDKTQPIPREQAVVALKTMAKETNPERKLFFAALEVAMQLNCWTIPADIKAIVDKKGWMNEVQGRLAAPVAPKLAPAPAAVPAQAVLPPLPGQKAAINARDAEFEPDEDSLWARDDEDSNEFDVFTRDAEPEVEAGDDDIGYQIWARHADVEDIDVELDLYARDSAEYEDSEMY